MGQALCDVLVGRKPERRPVWLMRQAGRYLPEYRKLRERAGSFLNLCYDPELAAEITLQPLRRFDFDAAIVFSDILIVPHGMGLGLDFVEGEGPKLSVVRDAQAVARLGDGAGSKSFQSVCETLQRTKRGLEPHQALIGFSGAPWTVASYMIEGGSSTRALALAAAQGGEAWFASLMQRLVQSTILYLVEQVRAGADVIQIFDSWAGDLPAPLQQRWVIEPIAAIIAGLRSQFPQLPIIVFARGLGLRHAMLAEALMPSAVGVEQGTDLAALLGALPRGVAIQGNLSPQALLGDEDTLVAEVRRILAAVPRDRHVFNLGHGILQETNPERVAQMLTAIRAWDQN